MPTNTDASVSSPSNDNKKSTIITSPSTLSSLQDYSFSYEAVLDEEETNEILLNYMKSIHCEESLLFLDCVNEFHRKRSTANKWTTLIDIFNRFFREESKLELNLPQRVRENVILAFEKVEKSNDTASKSSSNSLDQFLDLTECEEALRKAENYILVNLKEYIFPNFISSNMFKQFISKKPTSFLNKIGTVKNLSHSCFVESLMNMKRSELTVDEVRMIKKHVTTDHNWDLLFSKENTKAYISSKRYVLGEEDNQKGVHFAKCEVIFPYSVNQVMNIMTNAKVRLSFDKNLEFIKRIGYKSRPNNATSTLNDTQLLEDDSDTLSSTSSVSELSCSTDRSQTPKSLMPGSSTGQMARCSWPQ